MHWQRLDRRTVALAAGGSSEPSCQMAARICAGSNGEAVPFTFDQSCRPGVCAHDSCCGLNNQVDCATASLDRAPELARYEAETLQFLHADTRRAADCHHAGACEVQRRRPFECLLLRPPKVRHRPKAGTGQSRLIALKRSRVGGGRSPDACATWWYKNSNGSITMLVVPLCRGIFSLSTACPEVLH